MNIALTCSTYWPYSRMGQRYVHDLARYLSEKGHCVDIITSKPGRQRTRFKDGVRIIYHAQKAVPGLSYNSTFYLYSLDTLLTSLRHDYDVVQSLTYFDAFGTALGQRVIKKRRCFYLISNCEPFVWGGWHDRRMFETAIRSVTNVIAPSIYLNGCLREAYNMEGEVIPPGVNTSYFRPVEKKSLDPPTILCMSALIKHDKRIGLLVKAFDLLKRHIPEAVLIVSGHGYDRIIRNLLNGIGPGTRDSIRFLGVGREEDVPSLYAHATITVLPGVHQSFGMPLIESLSAGTPVVGARSGGIPEIIDSKEVGVLFGKEGRDEAEALCDAMIRGIEIAQNPVTQRLCRQHAYRYDWDTVTGPKLEAIYQRHQA